MRRSGTTLVFDLFYEDPTFNCFYEPLAEAKRPAVGGGSGAHQDDLFVQLRAARSEFLAANIGLTVEDLNYGAPREPQLEFEDTAPQWLHDYLASLLAGPKDKALKFTRMASKAALLHELDPNALFIHIVRDPKAVAASYLFGKGGKNRGAFRDSNAFFARASAKTAWSSREFSNYLLASPEHQHLVGCPDFYRVLLLWKHNFERTHGAAAPLFADRYLLLRYEDVVKQPDVALDSIYSHLHRQAPPQVRVWLHKHLAPRPLYQPDDARWSTAFDRIGMLPQLASAGYCEAVC